MSIFKEILLDCCLNVPQGQTIFLKKLLHYYFWFWFCYKCFPCQGQCPAECGQNFCYPRLAIFVAPCWLPLHCSLPVSVSGSFLSTPVLQIAEVCRLEQSSNSTVGKGRGSKDGLPFCRRVLLFAAKKMHWSCLPSPPLPHNTVAVASNSRLACFRGPALGLHSHTAALKYLLE